MKKVLFVLDLYKPHVGWVEVLFENIINRLEKKWYKIGILTSRFNKFLPKYEKKGNIEIYRIWHNRYDFMFFLLFNWIKIAKNYDLIHTTTYNSAIPSWIIWKFTKKKVILTVHEIFWKLWYKFMWWKWFFFKLFEDVIFKFKFDKYICVSNYTKNSIRLAYWINDKKLITIYNGIDYKKWDRNNYKKEEIEKIKKKYNLEKYYTWLYYWRPWISKWLEFYIKAIPEIIKKIWNFKAFLIVPENDKKRINYIKNLISTLKIENYVIWLPWVENSLLPYYILSSDFVIVPSLTEWFGFSAVETCSLWQKLIVSEIASLPEVVSWNVIFINPWDENSIVEAVKKAYKDDFLQIPSKKFTWDDNINKILKIYDELLWKGLEYLS